MGVFMAENEFEMLLSVCLKQSIGIHHHKHIINWPGNQAIQVLLRKIWEGGFLNHDGIIRPYEPI
jgi:hypothetical protein